MTGGNETRQVYETALFKKLNAIRNDLAELEGVPPSFIVSDTTLVELATYLPHGRDELRKIYGFTDTKIERYEEYFLETVIDYCARRGLRSRIHLKVPPRRADCHSEQLDLDIRNRRYSIDEIVERRGLKQGNIETQLADYVREGKLTQKSLDPPERAGRMLSALKGDSSLTAIK